VDWEKFQNYTAQESKIIEMKNWEITGI